MSRDLKPGKRGDEPGSARRSLAPGKRTLVANRYPTLGKALDGADGGRGGGNEPTIHDAATAAVAHKDVGTAVDGGVAVQVGAHLGADFGAVRVHQDPMAQEATQAMGARAFAYGGDVFLGAGESGSDLGLMAHELTHVVQQGAAGQRAPQRQVQVGEANTPAERQADQVAADVTGGQARPTALLVDDGPVGPGQMLKSQFIEQLRGLVSAAADEELGVIYSGIGCPYIDRYFERYTTESAAAGEALLRKFAPSTRTARTAADMIPAVVARVRDGVRTWRETGQPPPEIAAAEPAAAAAAGPAQAQALRAPDGRETLASLEADLGPGHALDGGTASRMSDALGADVSAARMHTGPVAARKADEAGALAFAVGDNVVMGARAPIAGTIEGDALLAHELAHVAQQSGAAADPRARMMPIGAESAAAEDHADDAAAGAMAGLHGSKSGLARLAERIGGAFKSGLQLQRCPDTPAEKAHKKLVELGKLGEGPFRTAITGLSRTDYDALMTNVSAVDQGAFAALLSRIRNERLVGTAEGLNGSLTWAGSSGADPGAGFQIKTTSRRREDDDLQDGVHFNHMKNTTNDFAVWVRGGAEPTDTSQMNCWEMIMYAGYKGGVISKQWILDTHTQAAAAGSAAGTPLIGVGAYQTVIGNRLNLGAAVPYVPGTAPPRGNIVFFDGIAHVALSTGNLVGGEAEVMSLWIVPTLPSLMLNSATQKTTIEAIQRGKGVLAAPDPRVGGIPAATMTVTHAPNPWR